MSYYTIYHIKYEYINSIDYFLKIDPTCRTKSWNSKKRQGKSFDIGNQKCALPFNYKGKEYRKCALMKKENVFSCPTQITSAGSSFNPDENLDKWGVCSDECPKEGK